MRTKRPVALTEPSVWGGGVADGLGEGEGVADEIREGEGVGVDVGQTAPLVLPPLLTTTCDKTRFHVFPPFAAPIPR